MRSPKRKIEVDGATATALKRRAAARGISVATFVSELIELESGRSMVPADELAELDRRWARVEAGQATVPQEQVVRWLETWGKPGFKPWHEQ
jgi:hypothetical protein